MASPPTAALPTEQLLPLFLLALFAYGVAEFGYIHFARHRARLAEYGMALKGLLFNGAVGALSTALFGPVSKTLLALWGASLTPLDAGLGPLGWVYGLVVYELMYWLQHWAAHKVRLLWCLHSPHHAPQAMTMFVGFNHSFLESLFYMPFALGFLTAVLGVHPVIVLSLTVVDVVWGNLLHLSDHVVRRRWGPLEYVMQTPSYHRVHHAQNVRYMDTNYNSITQLGDWLLGTRQPLDDGEPVRFGITRDVDTGSFLDVHFGEFRLLWRDLRRAGHLREALGYLFGPPGWQPDGEQQTAAARKARALGQVPAGTAS